MKPNKTPSMHFRDRVGWTCPKCGHRIYGIRHTTQKLCPYCGSEDITRDSYQMTENGYQRRYACRHCRRHFIIDSNITIFALILEKLHEYKSKGIQNFTGKSLAGDIPDYPAASITKALTNLFQSGLVEHIGYKRTGLTNNTIYVLREGR